MHGVGCVLSGPASGSERNAWWKKVGRSPSASSVTPGHDVRVSHVTLSQAQELHRHLLPACPISPLHLDGGASLDVVDRVILSAIWSIQRPRLVLHFAIFFSQTSISVISLACRSSNVRVEPTVLRRSNGETVCFSRAVEAECPLITSITGDSIVHQVLVLPNRNLGIDSMHVLSTETHANLSRTSLGAHHNCSPRLPTASPL